MNYTSSSNYYSLNIPDDWTIEEAEATISIYNEKDGFGVINITSYQIPENYFFRAHDELLEFVGGDINNEKLNLCKITDMDVASFEQIVQNTYWLYYIFYRKNKALFVTYNCNIDDMNNEKSLVDSIIGSLQIN
ncbi:MAG TPA: hypothetical protein VHB54_20995 [Mucilaginibacter sp.]|nr:hypothetical protein [Mucilaginibacter sp.]